LCYDEDGGDDSIKDVDDDVNVGDEDGKDDGVDDSVEEEDDVEVADTEDCAAGLMMLMRLMKMMLGTV